MFAQVCATDCPFRYLGICWVHGWTGTRNSDWDSICPHHLPRQERKALDTVQSLTGQTDRTLENLRRGFTYCGITEVLCWLPKLVCPPPWSRSCLSLYGIGEVWIQEAEHPSTGLWSPGGFPSQLGFPYLKTSISGISDHQSRDIRRINWLRFPYQA